MKLTAIHPKLPMRNKCVTIDYYVHKLGFSIVDSAEYPDYLMVKKDDIEIHFFLFPELDPKQNYGQVYIRTNNIEEVYNSFLANTISIHPNAPLQLKPWGQKEFALLDPDLNLITFGQTA